MKNSSETFCPTTPISIENSTDLLTDSPGLSNNFTTGPTDWSFNIDLVSKYYSLVNALGTMNDPTPLPGNVKQYVIIGYGLETLGSFSLGNPSNGTGSTVEYDGKQVSLTPNFVDGDGTDPIESMKFSTATASYYVSYKTNDSSALGNLPSNKRVQAIIGSMIDGNPLPPQEFSYSPQTAEQTSFTLLSGGHLTISESSFGEGVGYNGYGGINESGLTGSFVSTPYAEYASMQNATTSYHVIVNGTGVGQFTLLINITMNGSTLAVFAYSNVTMTRDTSAQVTIDAAQINSEDKIPPLVVKTIGTAIQIQPDIQVLNSSGFSLATSSQTSSNSLALDRLFDFNHRLGRSSPRPRSNSRSTIFEIEKSSSPSNMTHALTCVNVVVKGP